jgi:tRNA-Thr(GGU) m(6)t(6)A37 methyltransferase TsaA
MESNYVFNPIGVIHSCFAEKFGIPRQPGLAAAARAALEVLPPYDRDEAFRGIEDFSHLWIVFVFHGSPKGKWRPTVRPPRLGGNQRIGVFASRSGFRPNPIGISAVKLESVHRSQGKLLLELSGIDLLDQTPVLDIKPYLPYADAISTAKGGFANRRPETTIPVSFSSAAQKACARMEARHPGFAKLLTQVLGTDPRPAYVGSDSTKTEFGLRLYDINVRWRFSQDTIVVQSLEIVSDREKR